MPTSDARNAESRVCKMKERREKRKRWVRRGRYAVEVEVEVVYPSGDPSEPCLEPDTVRWLDEVARRAEKGDVAYLKSVGEVFRAVPSRAKSSPTGVEDETMEGKIAK